MSKVFKDENGISDYQGRVYITVNAEDQAKAEEALRDASVAFKSTDDATAIFAEAEAEIMILEMMGKDGVSLTSEEQDKVFELRDMVSEDLVEAINSVPYGSTKVPVFSREALKDTIVPILEEAGEDPDDLLGENREDGEEFAS